MHGGGGGGSRGGDGGRGGLRGRVGGRVVRPPPAEMGTSFDMNGPQGMEVRGGGGEGDGHEWGTAAGQELHSIQ